MLVAVAALQAPVTGVAADGTVLPPLSVPAATDSILVVAPHPDDETLCCAGFIQRAVQAGARVAIVWATSGDAFELDALVVEKTLHPKGAGLRRLAQLRIAEARAAATLVGVAADRQYFLGYPDRGLRRLMVDHYATPYRSRYTGAMAVPYAQALSPGAAYEGRNLERDLATVIEATRPTLVLAPGPEDRHTDHAVLGELVLRAMERRGDGSRVLTWIVHAGQRWPRPRGLHPELDLRPPPRLNGLEWQRFDLSQLERERKRRALALHRTQMEVMAGFLLGFVRADEIFSRTPILDTGAAPAPLSDSNAADAGLGQNGAH